MVALREPDLDHHVEPEVALEQRRLEALLAENMHRPDGVEGRVEAAVGTKALRWPKRSVNKGGMQLGVVTGGNYGAFRRHRGHSRGS